MNWEMPLESLLHCSNVHYLSEGKELVKSFQTQELNWVFFFPLKKKI